jgi:sialidase-1
MDWRFLNWQRATSQHVCAGGLAIAALALAGCAPQSPAAGLAREDLDHGGAGYAVYRIPALAVSTRGTLIAAYDGRASGADLPSHIAVVVRRSTDTGRTWHDRQVVRADSAPAGFGDPSLLVDGQTGRIFLFYAASVNAGFGGSRTGNGDDDPDILQADLSYSDDDGLTWRHRRLSHLIKDPAWGGLFAASGQGIQLQRGPHAGRLVQQYVIRYAGGNYAASLFSDDHGATWRMGKLLGPGLDENKTVELSDGRLLLNSRARPFRLVAYSADGGATYDSLHADSALVDPANNGSIIRVFPDAQASSPRSHWLLFSNTASRTSRDHLTVRLSCDDGRTWPEARTLEAGPAGYSTLAMLPDGSIGILYERGKGLAISFARFNLAWVGGSCS